MTFSAFGGAEPLLITIGIAWPVQQPKAAARLRKCEVGTRVANAWDLLSEVRFLTRIGAQDGRKVL
jgi:hypothetical protein